MPDTGLHVSRERAMAGPIVHGFGSRGFRIDGRYYPALLLSIDTAQDWAPPAFDTLGAEALVAVLEPRPEFVLLGTGAAIRRAPRPLVATLDAQGIGVETMDSRAAARAWGVLRGEGRRIAAALYPIDA